jgi:hypothetical protein
MGGSISQLAVTLHPRGGFLFGFAPPLFEIALVLVRLDHVASVIINADRSIM